MLVDYHIHSKFSPDSKAEISNIAASAVLRGVSEIAITDHYHIGRNNDIDFDEYFAEIRRVQKMYEGEFTIRSGIEIGDVCVDTKLADRIINSYLFDFVLASVHRPNRLNMLFFDFAHSDLSEMKKFYLSDMEKTVEWGNFDCLAHFDLPVRYAKCQGVDLDFDDFSGEIEGILGKVLEYGNKGLEVNLSEYETDLQKPMPSSDILKMWQSMGGRIVTIGTDSHEIGSVGKFVQEGQELLLSCGFSEFATFEKRAPILHEIEWADWE